MFVFQDPYKDWSDFRGQDRVRTKVCVCVCASVHVNTEVT